MTHSFSYIAIVCLLVIVVYLLDKIYGRLNGKKIYQTTSVAGSSFFDKEEPILPPDDSGWRLVSVTPMPQRYSVKIIWEKNQVTPSPQRTPWPPPQSTKSPIEFA